MVDFYSHILPDMDDGADSLRTSITILRESARKGVDILCATSHFYVEEDVLTFLNWREEACTYLRSAMKKTAVRPFGDPPRCRGAVFPQIERVVRSP